MYRWLVTTTLVLAMGPASPAWADCGDTDGEYDRGVAYATGEGSTPQDFTEAARFFCHAAAQGDNDAQLWLGRLYYDGHGVPEDYVQAYMWLTLAAADGDAVAAKQRDIVAAEMTPSQIERAKALAAGWKSTCQ